MPRLISPEAGERVGFAGSTVVTFDWSDVDDPSGVTYMFQIAPDADFKSLLLNKENLSESQYILEETEALDYGQYYWRVKAADGAGNESSWTAAQLFLAGVLEWWVFILVLIGGAGLVAAVIWRSIAVARW